MINNDVEYGELFSFGDNFSLQLGLGDNINRIIPQQVALADVVDISSGAVFAIALTSKL